MECTLPYCLTKRDSFPELPEHVPVEEQHHSPDELHCDRKDDDFADKGSDLTQACFCQACPQQQLAPQAKSLSNDQHQERSTRHESQAANEKQQHDHCLSEKRPRFVSVDHCESCYCDGRCGSEQRLNQLFYESGAFVGVAGEWQHQKPSANNDDGDEAIYQHEGRCWPAN